MKLTLFALALAGTAMMTTGCSTIAMRLGHEFSGSNAKLWPAPGVTVDVLGVLTSPVRTFTGEPTALLMVPYFAVDLPFSVAVDTCLLPHDIVQQCK